MNLLLALALISQGPAPAQTEDVVIAPEVAAPAESAPAVAEAPVATPAPDSHEASKEVVYQKITNLDLNGSKVEGEKGLPQEFFLYNVKTPKIRSFLEDRLKFSFRDYNELAN